MKQPPRARGRKARLSLDPQVCRDGHWYYEERRGLCVVKCGGCQLHECGPFIYLPWKKVEASVRRWRASRRKP